MTTTLPPPAAAPAEHDDEVVLVRKHTRASRWMHWINFPFLAIMIWSGLRIYWADLRDPYGVGIGFIGWHWFDLFPDWFNEPLGLERRLARGMAFHFTFGWLFTFNGIAYGVHLWRSGDWRQVIPTPSDFRQVGAVVAHDLHLRKTAPPQVGRYNAAQRIAYGGVLFLGVAVVVSGLAIFAPTQLSFLTAALGGYESARGVHFASTIGFVLFFGVHILQVVRSGFANFWSMVTGYERTTRAALVADAPSPPGDTADHDKQEVSA